METILKKIHKAILWFALLLLPVFLLYAGWTALGLKGLPEWLTEKVLNNLGLAWVLSLVYLIASLVFYKVFREKLMARLAGFREGDEREHIVTSEAARATFLLTLSVQIVFLILSLTSVHIVRNPDGHGFLSIGMGFGMEHLNLGKETGAAPVPAPVNPAGMEFKTYILPPGTTLILLALILTQLLAFRLFSRRRYEGNE